MKKFISFFRGDWRQYKPSTLEGITEGTFLLLIWFTAWLTAGYIAVGVASLLTGEAFVWRLITGREVSDFLFTPSLWLFYLLFAEAIILFIRERLRT